MMPRCEMDAQPRQRAVSITLAVGVNGLDPTTASFVVIFMPGVSCTAPALIQASGGMTPFLKIKQP